MIKYEALVNKKKAYKSLTLGNLWLIGVGVFLTWHFFMLLILHSYDGNDKVLTGPPSPLPDDFCLKDDVILSPSCMEFNAKPLSRPFHHRNIDSWCVSTDERGTKSQDDNGQWQSLLFVKVHKAYSSASAAVALRIHNHTSCDVQFIHREGIHYKNRASKSFLFTSIRQPASRAVSHANFFTLGMRYMHGYLGNNWLKKANGKVNVMAGARSNKNVDGKPVPDERDFIRALSGVGFTRWNMRLQDGQGGYQFNYLSQEKIEKKSMWKKEKPMTVIDPPNIHTRVKNVINSYDFIIIAERFLESITALALLTNLPFGTVISVAVKQSGQYYLIRNKPSTSRLKFTCQYQRSFRPPKGVWAYLNSLEWRAMNYADEILYRAANRSLDMTIERHLGGRRKFEKSLKKMEALVARVQDYCGERIGSGCTGEGKRIEPVEECYWGDMGCGYKCMDEVVGR